MTGQSFRVALLEVDHWHSSLYLPGLRRSDVNLVAVSDSCRVAGSNIAAEFGSATFTDYNDLLDQTDLDFVFAFGRHDKMPAIAESLISRRIPFSIEKPCGRTLSDVTHIRRLAEQSGLFVAVPYIWRISNLYGAIEAAEGRFPADISHISIRNLAGPPSRYLETVPWLLDPGVSGGGSAMNLGGHFIDLVSVFTGSRIASVFSRMSNKLCATRVEDYALIVLTHENGTVSTIEVGYTFPNSPEKREFSLTYSSRSHYFLTVNHGVRKLQRQDSGDAVESFIPMDLDTDSFYSNFVSQTIDDVCAGRPPIAGLRDLESVMEILAAAYKSAETGHVISV